MTTQIGVGTATLFGAEQATRAAVRQALSNLRGDPLWAIVFAAHKHDLASVLATARTQLPGTAILGCSTAGELGSQGLSRDSVHVMVASSDEMSCALRIATNTSSDYAHSSQKLCEGLDYELTRARQEKRLELASILLGDALQGPFEKLVEDVWRRTKLRHRMVGGAAGDDGAFNHTPVGIPGTSGTDCTVALHLMSSTPVGVGIGHGFVPLTEKMLVTKSAGSVISEVGGKPAYQVFVDYARERGLPPPRLGEAPMDFLTRIGGSLFGVYFLDDVVRVRGAHRVTENGGVVVSGEIPEGSNLCVIGADAQALVEAARAAAEEARDNLRGRPAAGVLVVSCKIRQLVLGDQYNREIKAIQSVFPNAPLCGFLSYGEIARFRGRLDGFHNATCVVAAIPGHV